MEAGNVGWVVVDALDGDVGGSEFGVEGGDEGRSDDVADVAVFGGAAGEDQCELFAREAGGDVVSGHAREVDVALYSTVR